MKRSPMLTSLMCCTLLQTTRALCEPSEGAKQEKETTSRDCPPNATVLSFSRRNFVINAYRSVAIRNNSSPTVVSIPCEHVEYAASLFHQSQPTYVFPPPTDGQCYWCHTFETRSLACAILDTCNTLNMTSFRLAYTDEFSHYQESIKQEADGIFVSEWKLSGSMSTASRLMQDTDYTFNGFVVVCPKHIAVDLIRMGRKYRLTRSSWHWVVIVQNANDWAGVILPGEKIILLQNEALINGTKYRGQMDDAVDRTYTLWTVSMTTQKLEYLGVWRSNSGLRVSFSDIWTFRRFLNKTYTIATIHLPAFHYKEEIDGVVVWKGICVEILDALAETFNFKYRLIEPPDQKWGGPIENGSWNGMIGMVLRGEADFALAKFTITSIRKEVVDFAFSFWYGPSVMVMKEPNERGLFVYLSPFRYDFWLTFALSVPLTSFIISCVYYIETIILGGVYPRRLSAIFADTLWFTFGSVFQQGSTWMPTEQATRFLVAGWWLVSVIVSATYTGNLIAALAVPRTVLPVQTLDDLAKQTTYTYGPVDGTAIYSLIKESSYHVYQKLWRHSIQYKENLVKNHNDGLQRVMRENFIYIGELSGVAPVVYNDCRYAIGDEEFFPSGYAFAFPQDDPYLPLFNERISNLVENGLIERWKELYYPKNKCKATIQSTKGPATTEQFQGALAVLCAGVVVAALTLALEAGLLIMNRMNSLKLPRIV